MKESTHALPLIIRSRWEAGQQTFSIVWSNGDESQYFPRDKFRRAVQPLIDEHLAQRPVPQADPSWGTLEVHPGFQAVFAPTSPGDTEPWLVKTNRGVFMPMSRENYAVLLEDGQTDGIYSKAGWAETPAPAEPTPAEDTTLSDGTEVVERFGYKWAIKPVEHFETIRVGKYSRRGGLTFTRNSVEPNATDDPFTALARKVAYEYFNTRDRD